MDVRCLKCKEVFILNTKDLEKEQTDQDKYSIQYTKYGSVFCPKCKASIDIENYSYWIENINKTIIDGSEILECSGAEIV